jgi:hypothetical protein
MTMLDERFFDHRRRSTSVAGMVAAAAALLLFLYRYLIDHVVHWDLLAIGAAFVLVKFGLMAWYYLTD